MKEFQQITKQHFSAAWNLFDHTAPFRLQWWKECNQAQLHAFKFQLLWDTPSDPNTLRYQDIEGLGDFEGAGAGWEELENFLTTPLGRFAFMSTPIFL
jgi:hypothetical protein